MRAAAVSVLTALAGCGSPRHEIPHPEQPGPRVGVEVDCALLDAKVECNAFNHGRDWDVGCTSPYVGVKRTGALIHGAGRACSPAVEPHGRLNFVAPMTENLTRACPTADDCSVEVFDSSFGNNGGTAAIVAFARTLAAGATARDPDHPSIHECEAARAAWLATPALAPMHSMLEPADAIVLICMDLERADFACLAVARSDADLDACGKSLGTAPQP